MNNQEPKNYTPVIIESNSRMNNLYIRRQQLKASPPKETIWTIPPLLEFPRSKNFQSPDLETDFLIDSDAESNMIMIPSQNEIQSLNPKFSPSKISSKLATEQGTRLIMQKPNYVLSCTSV